MKIVVYNDQNVVYNGVMKFSDDFKESFAFECYGFKGETGHDPDMWDRANLAFEVLHEMLKVRWFAPLVCLVKGHELVDDDPGDPEVGPQPCVYCVRCGR